MRTYEVPSIITNRFNEMVTRGHIPALNINQPDGYQTERLIEFGLRFPNLITRNNSPDSSQLRKIKILSGSLDSPDECVGDRLVNLLRDPVSELTNSIRGFLGVIVYGSRVSFYKTPDRFSDIDILSVWTRELLYPYAGEQRDCITQSLLFSGALPPNIGINHEKSISYSALLSYFSPQNHQYVPVWATDPTAPVFIGDLSKIRRNLSTVEFNNNLRNAVSGDGFQNLRLRQLFSQYPNT